MIFLLKGKGIKYTYNYIYFSLFYGTKNPLLINILYWLTPYPFYIEVEVTTRCNLRCIVCEHAYWDEPNRDMSFDEFKQIVNQFPRLKWIGLTGIGESFINKDFMNMLRHVKSRNIFVELYDSFYFIDEEASREIIDLGVDRIFASIDAATKETYEKIRVGSDFKKVIDNVRTLFKIRKEMRAHFPEIHFHYIVTKTNLEEVPRYIELVNFLSNGENTTIQFTRILHGFREVEDLFVEIPEGIMRLAKEKAQEFNIVVVWNADVHQLKPPITKCTEWTMPFIFVTWHVIPCCAGNEAGNRNFQRQTSLGNIYEQNFKEIWYGQRYKILRRMLRKGRVPSSCKNCCLYDIKLSQTI